MNKLFLLASSVLLLAWCGQSAITYNDTIVDTLDTYSAAYEVYYDSEWDAVQPAIDSSLVALKKARTDLEALGEYDGKRAFLDSALKLLDLYEEELTVIAPKLQAGEEISDETTKDFQTRMEAAMADINTQQTIFAAENNMQVQ